MLSHHGSSRLFPLRFACLIFLQLSVASWAAPLEAQPVSLLMQQTYATDHFRLAPNLDPSWSEQMGHLLERLYETFYSNLSQSGFDLAPPAEPLIWICFDDENEFSDYARNSDHFDASWLQGYYSTRTNRVALVRSAFSTAVPVANDGMTEQSMLDIRRISHELAHQLTWNMGLLKRGVMHPVWLTEGLATNFEAESLAEAGFLRINAVRLSRLVEIRNNQRLIPLDRFVNMTKFRPGSGVALSDLYAQADGLFNFLLVRRPDQLKAYMARLAKLPMGARSSAQLLEEFSDAFGAPAAVEAEWLAYLDELSRRLAKK